MKFNIFGGLFFILVLSAPTLFAGPVKITPQGVQFPDNSTQTAASPTFKNTIFVSPGASETESGTALLNALNGITDAAADNRYLLKLEPGIYNLGTTSLVMKAYVDIEGSGMTATVIKSNVYYTGTSLKGAVVGEDTSELRHLTISCDPETGLSSGNGIGLLNASETSSLYRVKIRVTGKNGYSAYGIYNSYAYLEDEEVSIHVSGGKYAYGILNRQGGTLMLKNSKVLVEHAADYIYGIYNGDLLDPAEVNSYYDIARVHIEIISYTDVKCYGLFNDGNAPNAALRVKWCQIDANRNAEVGAAIYSNTNGYTVLVMDSLLTGGKIVDVKAGVTGNYKCVYCSDNNFDPLGSSCTYP